MSRMISTWGKWPTWWRRSLVLTGGLLVLCLGGLYWCSRPDYLERIDRPMTLAQARRVRGLADFPFPASAHNIYYAGYSDWISYEALIRFDAPQEDCKAAVPKIFEWSQNYSAGKPNYPVVALENETSLPELVINGWFSNVTWWSGLTINHGYSSGDEKWGTRQLLIDSDLDRLYFSSSVISVFS